MSTRLIGREPSVGAAVTLQVDGDHLPVLGERRNDRPHMSIEQSPPCSSSSGSPRPWIS